MALAASSINNGKRSVRNDYDYGGGDVNLMMMVERETVASTMQKEPKNMEDKEKKIGGLVGANEMTAMGFVVLAIYLINGEYAHTICTTITSVPPAIFSYRVLINNKTSKEGYHSILFYWTLYGIFALIDQIVANAHGYNLCKGGLLGTVFLHSLRTNQCSIPKSWQNLNIFAKNQVLQTVFTQFDSQGFMKRTESSHFIARSPTQTEFSDASEYMLPSPRDTPEDEEELSEVEFDYIDEGFDVSTACSFQPSMEMQTTQKISPPPMTAKPQQQQQQQSFEAQKNRFASMSALTITAGGPNKDIVTVPMDRIEFCSKVREATITVTNISPLHMMFSLKTNADTYLIAAPTTGFLKSGQTISIRVGVTDEYFSVNPIPGRSIDKLAIDYSTLAQNMSQTGARIQEFDQEHFQNSIRRRHAIRVYYK